MKFIFLLLFFPLVAQAQQLKPGLYIKTKVELIDGREDPSKVFLKYNFLKDGAVQLGVEQLFYSVETTYSLIDSILTIGRIDYKIDRLTNDSLIIHENKPNIDPEKFRKYYFVNSGSARSKPLKLYDENFKDSVYVATKNIFPQYNGTKGSILSNFGSVKEHCSLKIGFIIDKDGKPSNFKLLENNNADQSFIKKVADIFTTKLKDWVPAQFNNKDVNAYVVLMLTFNGGTIAGYGYNSIGISLIDQGL